MKFKKVWKTFKNVDQFKTCFIRGDTPVGDHSTTGPDVRPYSANKQSDVLGGFELVIFLQGFFWLNSQTKNTILTTFRRLSILKLENFSTSKWRQNPKATDSMAF